MVKCENCQHENSDSARFCEQCGFFLSRTDATDAAPSTQALKSVPREIQPPSLPRPGTRTFTDDMLMVLDFGRFEDRLIMRVSVDEEITFGRVDRLTTILPRVNLARMGAWDKGVSRLHAAIRRRVDQLELVDLGSTNGTFLNNKRLNPHDPAVLHSGDTVRMALLNITVVFERA